jgi:ABC-type oligopeptide transport system substrate-binding subunit
MALSRKLKEQGIKSKELNELIKKIEEEDEKKRLAALKKAQDEAENQQ